MVESNNFVRLMFFCDRILVLKLISHLVSNKTTISYNCKIKSMMEPKQQQKKTKIKWLTDIIQAKEMGSISKCSLE